MKYKYLIILMAFLLIPFISGELIFTQNQESELKIPCSIEGAMCSSGTGCKINIQYPNKTSYLRDNVSMTNLNNGDFNITFNDSELTYVGTYPYSIFCTDGTYNGSISDSFKVTPTGNEITTAKSIVNIIAIVMMIVVLFVFLILAGVFTHAGTKIFFLGLSLTTIVFTVGFILRMLQDNVGEYASFTSTYAGFYTLLTILLIGGGMALMLYLIWFTFTTFNKVRGYID